MLSKSLFKCLFFSAVFLLILACSLWAQNYSGTWKMEYKNQNTLKIEALGSGKFNLTGSGPITPAGSAGTWHGYAYTLSVNNKTILIAAFTYNTNDGGFVTISEITSNQKIKYISYNYQGGIREEGYYVK